MRLLWIYAGDSPVVHLVEISGTPGTGAEASLKLEHFAFSATDCNAFIEKLNKLGVQYPRGAVPSANLIQINVRDPDSNHIHVDFPADE